jgi:hypothetical protein
MPRPSTPSATISIPVLARSLGYSTQWLYNLLRLGRGPYIEPHGKFSVIRLDDAIQWC